MRVIWKIDKRKTMNIAVFASHGGSDLQAIIDGCKNNISLPYMESATGYING